MPKPYKHVLIAGKFAPPHRGHQLLIERALDEGENLTLLVYNGADFAVANRDFTASYPAAIRAEWVRELYPQATVIAPDEAETPPLDAAPDREHHDFIRGLLERRGLMAPDAVFTSEAYGDGWAACWTEVAGPCTHRQIDLQRGAAPISGTSVRADPHAHRAMLDPRIYRHFVRRIVLLGAESTGKSTLTERLARELGTSFVPEYGRTLWEERGGDLNLADFVLIARTHRQREDEAILTAYRYLFVDTNALTTALYAFLYHRSCPPEVLAWADECQRRYAYTFVCADDFPFVQDGTRTTVEVQRVQQSAIFYDLAVRRIPYQILRGTMDDRARQVASRLSLA